MDIEADVSVFRDSRGRLHVVIESGRLGPLLRQGNYLEILSGVVGKRLCLPPTDDGVSDRRLVLFEAEPLVANVGIAGMLMVIILSVISVLTLILLYDELIYIAYDEEAARVAGVKVQLINYVFSILVASAISVSIRIVGVLVISSMIALPVATALQLEQGFKRTLVWSIVFSVIDIMMISQTCATSIIMKHFLSNLFDPAILSDPRAQYNGQSAEKRARAEQKRSNSSTAAFI